MTGEPDELRREMQGYFALAFGLAWIVWRGIGPYFLGRWALVLREGIWYKKHIAGSAPGRSEADPGLPPEAAKADSRRRSAIVSMCDQQALWGPTCGRNDIDFFSSS